MNINKAQKKLSIFIPVKDNHMNEKKAYELIHLKIESSILDWIRRLSRESFRTIQGEINYQLLLIKESKEKQK